MDYFYLGYGYYELFYLWKDYGFCKTLRFLVLFRAIYGKIKEKDLKGIGN